MKITEIEFNTGKSYKDEHGLVWNVLKDNLVDFKEFKISNLYTTKAIASIEFEEVVDWSKVEVDDPILVKSFHETEWSKRHFAKFEKGTVFAYQNGKTSWTNEKSLLSSWDIAKLGDAK